MHLKIVPTMAYLFIYVLIFNFVSSLSAMVNLSTFFEISILVIVTTGTIFPVAGVLGKVPYIKANDLNRFFMILWLILVHYLLFVHLRNEVMYLKFDFMRDLGVLVLGALAWILFYMEKVASSFYLDMVKQKSE